MNGVVNEGGVRVQVPVLEVEAPALVQLGVDDVPDHVLDLRFVDVHQPERGEVRPAVLKQTQKTRRDFR